MAEAMLRMSGAESLGTSIQRARYTAAQGARVAWYAAHYALARRLTRPLQSPQEPQFRPSAPAGDPKRIRAAFLDLFAKDRANIEAVLYAPPRDFGLKQALAGLRGSMRFLADLPQVNARRLARRGVEVRNGAPANERLPAYFLQNFHFQTGGWLTEESADLYDTQVEILFGGAADAMRRIALGALAKALKGQDQRTAHVVDLACGNGRFIEQVLVTFPRLRTTGIDLSAAYVNRARKRLAPWRSADIVIGAGEAMPLADESVDALTCIYLFHELPPRVRRDVARDIARVLKPGGVFVFADSIQLGETPDLDQMLEYFPIGFHEPFFESYQREDLTTLFAEQGLRLVETEKAFLTKVMRFEKR